MSKKILHIARIFKRTFWKYKLQIATIIGIGFVSGILEGIGANALIPLFSFVVGDGEGGTDFISRNIEKTFHYLNVDFEVTYLLVFIALVFVVKAIVIFAGEYLQTRIIADYENETRSMLFKKTLKASWSYLLHHKIGYLELVLFTDVKKADAMLKSLSEFVLAVSQMIMYLIVAFNVSSSMTFLTLGIGTFLLLAFSPLFIVVKRVSYTTRQLSRKTLHFINEIVLGLKTLKITATGEKVGESSDHYFKILRNLRIKKSVINAIPPVIFQPLSMIFILFVFGVSYNNPDFNIASFIVVIYLIQRMLANFSQLQTHGNRVFETVPYLEDMLRYGEDLEKSQEEYSGRAPFEFKKTFTFKDVSFSYTPGREVLSHINFEIKKGQFVGLVGPSGAGKTTIVDLALRLFKQDAGSITLDGKEISEINIDDYRNSIGYVSQDIYLMNDTVENNIKFYNEELSHSDMLQAAEDANIRSFVETLPQGFKTFVGERGMMLSAGQRQRVAIARVLARKPEFLILDEATSALDNESEAQVQKVIEQLKGKITTMVIAHRLGTVMNCDNLLVLEQGKIIEQGNPHELLKDKDSYFYKVFNIRK